MSWIEREIIIKNKIGNEGKDQKWGVLEVPPEALSDAIAVWEVLQGPPISSPSKFYNVIFPTQLFFKLKFLFSCSTI